MELWKVNVRPYTLDLTFFIVAKSSPLNSYYITCDFGRPTMEMELQNGK